ncbi:short-chain fatty acid transporter [Ascidiimonas sp. W6]|uniref:short-chain fatty acid transporter n=1 Tax=Ascidiimonas meishanensis TaxID=3128903 RepID=UPI0030EE6321
MNITTLIETLFRKYLPSPFTIAVLLSLFTLVMAFFFTGNFGDHNHLITILKYWEQGIWNSGLLVFAYQMMLILVLGHILVLSRPMSMFINKLVSSISNAGNAVVLVSFSTLLVSFFNWGLGLIFGAIMARKVGEHAQKNEIPINYPLIGACGYVGLMVWHGGISGSAPLKVAEKGHLSQLMQGLKSPVDNQIPKFISTGETIFSVSNLIIFVVLLWLVPMVFYRINKTVKPTEIYLEAYQTKHKKEAKASGSEKLDRSRILSLIFGVLILLASFFQYKGQLTNLTITPNFLNIFMLGLGVIMHRNFNEFLNALEEAIKGTSGILIQFPLYFGIMGVMSSSGMVGDLSAFFVSVSNEVTLPIFTFFSAGIVNIFVPSGGGQWAVQGPIIIESAMKLGVPLPKAVMALAYGDQLTNMLQPFWALPLLGITKLKAKEILPYTLLIMMVGMCVYIIGLLIF